MDTHLKVVGMLNMIYGALGLLVAFVVALVFGGVAGIVGFDGDPDAAMVIPILGITGGFAVMLILLLSLPSLIIGYGLYQKLSWGRIAGIVLSIINIFSFPFGTALGIYGLWVLFSDEGRRLFETAPAA